MKRLRRKTAGVLSAAMLLMTALPSVPTAVMAAETDDTATVTVENVPGGVIVMEETETGNIFPLDKPIAAAALLEAQPNKMLGTTQSGWVDESGKSIQAKKVSALADNGEMSAYAAYTDYKLPTVKKPETILNLADIYRSEDGTYLYGATDERVTNAFVSEDGKWKYLGGSGEIVKEALIESKPGTIWYEDLGDDVSGYAATKPNTGVTGKILSYADADGALVMNAWIADEYAAGGADWYYFDETGKAYVDTSVMIEGQIYYFDAEGRCILPGWAERDGEWVFNGADGKPVKKAFAMSNEKWFWLDENGYQHGGPEVIEVKRGTIWYQLGEDEYSLFSQKRDANYKSSKIYYYLGEDGSMQMNTWNEDNTMYFGADGRAYQDCTAVIDGVLYKFAKDGIAEEYEPLEEGRPSNSSGRDRKA